jgi:hypothetical protein
MIRCFILIFAIFLASNLNVSFAQAPRLEPSPSPGGLFEGTPQEREACQPDVMRLCREFVPDTFRVLACLQGERARLSNACQLVLKSHGQ